MFWLVPQMIYKIFVLFVKISSDIPRVPHGKYPIRLFVATFILKSPQKCDQVSQLAFNSRQKVQSKVDLKSYITFY